MKNLLLTSVLYVLTLVVLYLALPYLTEPTTGILTFGPQRPAWFPTVLRIHIATGGIAMLAGLFLLAPVARRRWPRAHRWVGAAYGVAVIVSGVSGLLVAPYSLAGWTSASGFSVLALLWLGTTVLAIRAAINGRMAEHRRWVAYSLALTYASITFRLMLLVFLATAVPFLTFYGYASWWCW
ncbi:MAG: DUF2306 domain-containing protein, partial [Bacteroidota bacterium]